MNLNNLNLLKARFGNSRNFDDLIDTLAAINKPPQSMIQSQIPFFVGNSGIGIKLVAHALGAVPSTHRVGIQVIPGATPDSTGWAAGSVIDQSQIYYLSSGNYIPVVSSVADANYVYVIQSQAPASFYVFSNATSPVLTLITPANWGYQVYAELDYIVTQPTDPFVVIQPASLAVTSPTGGSPAFILSATGTATLVYQWQVSSNSGASWAVASGGVYSNNTTNALWISSSVGLNGYQYRCVITNGVLNSTVSNVVTLSVS